MRPSRLPALLALTVMLVAAPVPWRVSAHADEHHGHVWLPGEHAWEHLRDHHGHDHAAPHDAGHAHDGCCDHDSECPPSPEEHGCHCGDEPLATGVAFAVVTPPPHLPAEASAAASRHGVSPEAPEVAPSEPGGRRRACEEDPIVLLR